MLETIPTVQPIPATTPYIGNITTYIAEQDYLWWDEAQSFSPISDLLPVML